MREKNKRVVRKSERKGEKKAEVLFPFTQWINRRKVVVFARDQKEADAQFNKLNRS